jgi:hypothetical protein
MTGLDPAIQAVSSKPQSKRRGGAAREGSRVDGRVNPRNKFGDGHDGGASFNPKTDGYGLAARVSLA